MSIPKQSGTTLFVCVTCRAQTAVGPSDEQPRAGARLLPPLETAPSELRAGLPIAPAECLSNCSRACSVAVTAPGKWTYVFGALDPDVHAQDLLAFARLHQAHEAGLPAWRERPEYIRKNTVARVPALTTP